MAAARCSAASCSCTSAARNRPRAAQTAYPGNDTSVGLSTFTGLPASVRRPVSGEMANATMVEPCSPCWLATTSTSPSGDTSIPRGHEMSIDSQATIARFPVAGSRVASATESWPRLVTYTWRPSGWARTSAQKFCAVVPGGSVETTRFPVAAVSRPLSASNGRAISREVDSVSSRPHLPSIEKVRCRGAVPAGSVSVCPGESRPVDADHSYPCTMLSPRSTTKANLPSGENVTQ
mmetsp:Transcript_15374/g.39635  ORF Transcript_15374/g.39635 Transcript_15374/m.39635 type:complete len:235 (-) Transcript_15374:588-1292(-)